MPYSSIEAKPIGYLCQIIDCEHKTAPYVEKSEFLVVRTSNVRNGQLVMDDMKFTTEAGYREWTERAVPEYGDVLFTREAPAGETCLVPQNTNVCMGQRMVLLRPRRKVADPFFLSQILATEKCKFSIKRLSIGSTVSRINISDIKSLRVAAPPLPEQKKIAQILSTWDQAITATERLLENSQQRKRALMQQLLTGKKRLPGFEGEWETIELGSLGSTYSGLSGKTKEDFGAGEPFVTYMSVFSDGALRVDRFDRVRLSDSEFQNKVQYGDILFTTSSETPEEVGMTSVLLEKIPYDIYLNSFCFGFRLYSFEKLVPEYARYLFRGEEMRRRIAALAQGATRYNLSKKQLVKLDVLLPGNFEQAAISKVLAASDMEVSAIKYRLRCLRDEKKALMQQLLTGKKRVQVEAA
ncbi:restriction endonuclease subunit S [Larsenimonas suaedae]|uniref:Restriction endonuclease subunit S n=1 Tax=Larsenimonas suaedae TaxID=1851019 RepID=A0ABU1GTL3_9GAMM|nr:restriction endonuclease subunit S [Larsenimonas suaedae]MCM2971801.1 restriction endonuclease subunit S [Larsenimonas suaedae]MDR5895353.1 restriction endonuclease subunit S [Larsenimonas suaedae]